MIFKKSVCYLIALHIAVLFLLPGCGLIQISQSSDPHVITHHTWWNHYQRGRLYLQENNYAAAINDFEIALGRRPGARYPYTQERWRARTYGMHMIEGYFPHRELGICLFYMNQPEEALELLETSTNMEPSARAKFYINRLHQQMAIAAMPPPRIEMTAVPNWTNQRSLTLQGFASGSNEVVRLTINGTPEFIELAGHNIPFREELQLLEGDNRIEILAEDISGKQTLTNVVLTADWTPPRIHLYRQNNELKIECVDNFGISRVELNGQTVSVEGKEYSVTQPITPNQPLLMTVTDKAGNPTEWLLSEKELAHLQQNSTPAPPILHVNHAGETIVQVRSEYMLDIRAEDDTALKSVELNQTPLLNRATPLFRAQYRIPLVAGTNQLSLVVEDSDGNRTKEQINVIYRQSEYLDRIYRLAALQSPLTGEIQDPAFAQRAHSLISENLTADPVRFYLLATEEDDIQLQNEYDLSSSELSDPRAMLKRGKKLDADLLFITRILSDAPGQTVYTRVLDARSGEDLFIEDVYVETPAELPQQLSGLVMKLEQHFPVIRGSVIITENQLLIDSGATAGVQKGMRLLLVRSPDTFEKGQLVVDENRPVELVISKVETESAEVILAKRYTEGLVRPGDYVYSR
jgi:hypothetical protein